MCLLYIVNINFMSFSEFSEFLLKFSFADLAVVFQERTLHWFCYTTCGRFLCENTSAIYFPVFFNSWIISTDRTLIMPSTDLTFRVIPVLLGLFDIGRINNACAHVFSRLYSHHAK